MAASSHSVDEDSQTTLHPDRVQGGLPREYANGWPTARFVSGARLVVIQVTARVDMG